MSQFWRGRSVLVTGAGGFIGSHLCETLIEAGAQVTAMIHYDSRPNRSNLEFLSPQSLKALKIISGDVCDPFFVSSAVEGMDTVFHLAALIAIPYSYVAPQIYFRTNVEGTLNIAEACLRKKVRRLVHTSTSETYGTAVYTPIDEKHPLQGQSPYSASKIGADKVVESYYCAFELPAVTLRPFNTFGPRQSARAVIPTMISQLLSDAPTVKLGDLSPVRDMNFVKDTAAAFLKVAEEDRCIGGVFNCGSGRAHTVGDIYEMLQKITGRNKEVLTDENRRRPEKSEVFTLIADARRLTEFTGWRQKFSLEDGLREAVEFVRAYPNQFRAGEYAL